MTTKLRARSLQEEIARTMKTLRRSQLSRAESQAIARGDLYPRTTSRPQIAPKRQTPLKALTSKMLAVAKLSPKTSTSCHRLKRSLNPDQALTEHPVNMNQSLINQASLQNLRTTARRLVRGKILTTPQTQRN